MNAEPLQPLAMFACGFLTLAACATAGEPDPNPPGLETTRLTEKSLSPEIATRGSVISPAPLIDLFRQIDAARAALDSSKQSAERAATLFGSGKLVAEKDVQSTRAQVVQDDAKLKSLEDRLTLEWGAPVAGLAVAERAAMLEKLLAGRLTLLRLSVRGSGLADVSPTAARLHSFGQEDARIRCEKLFAAPSVEAGSQSQAFFGVIETPKAPLPSGLALSGVFELAGQSRVGMLVPRNAVVFHLGKAWIYQPSGSSFTRVEIPTDTPVDGGWFVARSSISEAPVVIKGPQMLLSRETLRKVDDE